MAEDKGLSLTVTAEPVRDPKELPFTSVPVWVMLMGPVAVMLLDAEPRLIAPPLLTVSADPELIVS